MCGCDSGGAIPPFAFAVAGKVWKDSNQAIAANLLTVVTFPALLRVVGGLIYDPNEFWRVPSPGFYQITASLRFLSAVVSNKTLYIAGSADGVTFANIRAVWEITGAIDGTGITQMVDATLDPYWQFQFFTTAALTIAGNANHQTAFSIFKVSD